MRAKAKLVLIPLLVLGACAPGPGEPIRPTSMAAALLPDGSSVGGYMWAEDDFMATSRTVAMFQCGANNKKCEALSAGTLQNPGVAQVLAATLQGAAASAIGASLAPRPLGGGVFVNAPETLVQQMVGPVKTP